MKIFYTYSTQAKYNDVVLKMHNNICNSIDKNITIVNAHGETNSNIIRELINECDMFICDMTLDGDSLFYNKPVHKHCNVVLELGIALQKFNKNDIIIITNNYTMSWPLISDITYIKYTFKQSDHNAYIPYNHHIVCNSIAKIINDKYQSTNKYQLKIE